MNTVSVDSLKRNAIAYYGILLSVLIPTLFIHWYAYGQGLILTPDSYHYLSASKSFWNGGDLLDTNGKSFLFWPPLFPIVISIFSSPQEQLVWMNMLMIFLISIPVFKITTRVIQSTPLVILCFISVLFGVHLLLIASFFWTELVFLCFVLFFINNLLKSRENQKLFYTAIIFGFLMCLQRNAGLFIAMGASIWLFIQNRNLKYKLYSPLLFFILVSSGSIVWNLYVWFYLPHPHFNFSEDLFQNAIDNYRSLCYAIVNVFLPIKHLPIPIFLLGSAAFIYFFRKKIFKSSSFQLLFSVSFVYLFFLSLILVINIAGFRIYIGDGERFISVVIPFLSIMFFKVFDDLANPKTKLTKRIVIFLLVLWLVYPVSRTVKNAAQWHEVNRAVVSSPTK